MKTFAVIPARFASTRFPGKPLALIHGKPMVQWVIEGVQTARRVDEVIVATDHLDIASVAKQAGARPVMTASDLPSGSDRVWDAIKSESCELIINIQGDEPLISGDEVDCLIDLLRSKPKLQMATLATELSANDLDNLNIVKVVCNQNNEAIYFSRFPIPYSRCKEVPPKLALKHIGIYGYRKSFLQSYCEHGVTSIEEMESLEQLRALFLGAKIGVLQVTHRGWGIDTQEDLLRLERILKGNI
jgi:3-deoxy-manno-octulosonate cytidylyltransferase (CMP-KDO synthetase)